MKRFLIAALLLSLLALLPACVSSSGSGYRGYYGDVHHTWDRRGWYDHHRPVYITGRPEFGPGFDQPIAIPHGDGFD